MRRQSVVHESLDTYVKAHIWKIEESNGQLMPIAKKLDPQSIVHTHPVPQAERSRSEPYVQIDLVTSGTGREMKVIDALARLEENLFRIPNSHKPCNTRIVGHDGATRPDEAAGSMYCHIFERP